MLQHRLEHRLVHLLTPHGSTHTEGLIMAQTFDELVLSVTADGKVDASEVAALRAEIMDDGKVDRNEAEGLFKINDVCSDNDAGFTGLFVDCISSHVLDDDESPGEVDADEAAWLKGQIYGDGTVDDNELALIANLKAKVKGTIPADLEALFALAA